MALVTVQRSPSPSTSPEPDLVDGSDESEEEIVVRSSSRRSSRVSESYLAVKGAAMILPQSDCHRRITRGSLCGDISRHLQSMFYLIRPQDQIKIVVKLQSSRNHTRYLVIVSCIGRQDTEECAILGVDVNGETTIGLVFPIWADVNLRLDGDGGFAISSQEKCLFFKPVSVQAMWSALQCLHRVSEISRHHYYFPGGLTHTWLGYYQSKIRSSQECINEWEAMDDLMVLRSDVIAISCDTVSLENKIRTKLKEIMMIVDLEEVTTRYLRMEVEKALGTDLKEYRGFIDQETMTILGQLDKPSLVLDYLYLGSEWNASNLDELKRNNVGYILNVTREIDNFFPGLFEYMNIRLYDNVQSDLLRYWEKTYKFIKQAQLAGSKCLVHCKMGISRSAATVIAFLMKEFNWSASNAMKHTADIRSCINPNEAFRAQLLTYEGILDASNQRHNELWQPSQPKHITPNPDDDLEFIESQGTLKEIAEEILASKYGQPPSNPLFLDDVELSSRSMDSMDECFPEIPTSINSDSDNIELLYYGSLSDRVAEPVTSTPIALDKDQASSSSDSSELTVAFYNCLRAHRQGQYDRHYSPSPLSPDTDNPALLLSEQNDPASKGHRTPKSKEYGHRFDTMRLNPAVRRRFCDDGTIEIRGRPKQNVPVMTLGSDLLSESSTDDCRLAMEPHIERSRSPALDFSAFRSVSPLPGGDSLSTTNGATDAQEMATSPPAVSRRKKAKMAAASRCSESTDESFEVFQIGDEEVVVKKGKVLRHTADFEQLKLDFTNKEPEEEIVESEIPPKGVVKVQKQAFESIVSMPCAAPVSPLSSSPKQTIFRVSPPIEDSTVRDNGHTRDEECELPSAGIVQMYRKTYERDKEDSAKKPVKKVVSDPYPKSVIDSPRPNRLPSESECVEDEQMPVKNLVHRFEQQSPVEELKPVMDDFLLSVSAPSSPAKFSRKSELRPHSSLGVGEFTHSRKGSNERPHSSHGAEEAAGSPCRLEEHRPHSWNVLERHSASKDGQNNSNRKVKKAHGKSHPLERLITSPKPLTKKPSN